MSLAFSRSFRPTGLLPALTLLLAGSNLHAQVASIPAVVGDVQIPYALTSGGGPLTLSGPAGVAVAPDGTIYVADAKNGRMVEITPGAVNEVSSPATLAGAATVLAPPSPLGTPNAVAVDATGTLYFSDIAKNLLYRVTSPEGASPVYTALTYSVGQTPSALATDAAGNLYVADAGLQKIAVIAAGATTGTATSVSPLVPTGIAVSSTGSVYFADAKNSAVYLQGSGSPTQVLTNFGGTPFSFSADQTAKRPTGLGFDGAGNLYVLDASASRLVEVNPANTAVAFLVPMKSVTPASMGVGPTGNLYVTDGSLGQVDAFIYNGNSLNFGSVTAGTNSSIVTANYSFNNGTHLGGYYQRMQGDSTGEFVNSGTGCSGQKIAGSTCQQAFYVNYQSKTPGLRTGIFALADNSGNPVAPISSYGISLAGSLALFPGTVTALSQSTPNPTLYEPQGLTISGNGNDLFVADEGGQGNGGNIVYLGKVYDYSQTSGTVTQLAVNALQTPTALALDATGNLYIADYNTASIYVVPASNRSISSVLTIPGTVKLTHPISLAFDPAGNLYIGDSGPGGSFATTQNPGYIVKLPVGGGAAIKYNYTINGGPVIFPQALGTDSVGNLYIADGGDGQTILGSVSVVPANGSTPSMVSTTADNLDQPAGLSFDAANNLYVLDGYNQQVLIYPITLSSDGTPSVGRSTPLSQDLYSQGIYTASNLVVWPGGHNLTVSALGEATQGIAAKIVTVQSTNTSVNLGSPAAGSITVSVSASNVGSAPITFGTFTETGDTGAFSIPSTVCPGSNVLAVQGTCLVNVTYTPDQSGSSSASFALTVGGVTASNTITATGANVVPQISLTSNATNPFGTSPATITLKNTGLAALIVTNMAMSGSSQFTLSNGTCGGTSVTLQPSASCTMLVSFTSSTAGINPTVTATFTVTDNSYPTSGGSSTQSLSFTADNPMGKMSLTSDYNSTSTFFHVNGPATITLTNTGGANLTVSNMAMSGSGAFSLSNGTCGGTSVVLVSNQSCTMLVYFDATDTSTFFGITSVAGTFTATDNSYPFNQPASGTPTYSTQTLSFAGYGMCGFPFGSPSCKYAISAPGGGRLGNGPRPLPGRGLPTHHFNPLTTPSLSGAPNMEFNPVPVQKLGKGSPSTSPDDTHRTVEGTPKVEQH